MSKVSLLRVHLKQKEAGLKQDSDIIIDQAKAIDNRRFVQHLGKINTNHKKELMHNLSLLILE